MSWSASGRGPVAQVAVQMAAGFAKLEYLTGDEKKLMELSKLLVFPAIAAQPGDSYLKVQCVGRASSDGHKVTQYVSVLIEPVDKAASVE